MAVKQNNKLRNFLEELHISYISSAENKEDALAQIKLGEISEILKNFSSKENREHEEKIKIESQISHLITSRIDENVLVGNNLIEKTLPLLNSASLITDKNVLPLFKNYFEEKNSFVIDAINGESLTKIISLVKNNNSPFLVGIGGGRVMDYLKYIQLKTNKFCLAIPSSLATHVYSSPKIHVYPAIAELGEKKTIDGPVPDISIIDAAFLSKVHNDTPRLIQAGLGDIMACISALEDWKLAEEHKTTKVNHAIISMVEKIIDNLKKIDITKPLPYWLEEYIFTQVLLCRVSGWAGSAPVSGSEHLFALAAEHGFEQPPIHGELVALGTIIMSYIHQKDYKSVQQLAKNLSLPVSLSAIGLSKEQAINALYNAKDIAAKKGRFTIINVRDMNREYCEKIIDDLLNEEIIEE